MGSTVDEAVCLCRVPPTTELLPSQKQSLASVLFPRLSTLTAEAHPAGCCSAFFCLHKLLEVTDQAPFIFVSLVPRTIHCME